MSWDGVTFPAGGIYCLGSIVLDVLVRPVEALPAWSATEWVDTIEQHLGGNGAAAAFAAALLGTRVKLAGMVGEDAFGRYALDRLRTARVDLSHVEVRPGVQTASTVGLINRRGDRLFFHLKGASDEFDPGPLSFDPAALEGVSYFHVASVFQMRKVRAGAAALLDRAHRAGLFVSLDTLWDPSGLWMEDFAALCPRIDCLFVNHLEAHRLTGTLDPRAAAGEFQRRGVSLVVLKRAVDGCAVFGPGGECFIPAYDVPAVDTTGAGDTFCGAFLSGLSRGYVLPEAARLANAVAAHCVRRIGGTEGLADFEETTRWMETAAVKDPSACH